MIVTLEIDPDRLAESAGRHWSTSSALADDLVRTQHMSYRAAHEAVAHLIIAHEMAGEHNGNIRPDLAEQHLPSYSQQRLTSIMDHEISWKAEPAQAAPPPPAARN